MACPYDPLYEHILRRAGFGARPDELARYRQMAIREAVDVLLNYQRIPDDVDQKVGQPGYAGMTSAGAFSPRTVVTDARQRWLFRMIHTNRPLQEKMTLFWHNHFATGYAKIQGVLGAAEATRYMAAKPGEDPAGVRGQIEMLRDNALGNFRDLLVNIAKDTAMLVWLDGNQNVRGRPQENFARELMELFTMGVNTFTEEDVYAAARVFTGWNLTRPGQAANGTQHYEFAYFPNRHDTAEKTFSFPIYANGGRTIPARPEGSGMQDGLDLIEALAASPTTARYLATKLYRFFVSESGEVSESFLRRVTAAYFQSRYDMKWVMREVLLSPEFLDERAYFARFAWPVEFVVRSIKDVGWTGFSLGNTLGPLGNMGQNLFDPPDVNGWEQGAMWFSTGSMLARMNFAATLAGNQRFNLANGARDNAATPDALLTHVLESIRTAPLSRAVVGELSSYLTATGPWTASRAQLEAKVPALVHLIAGTPEYQFV
jgi:uncharacterized protein (DUF1800 family)